LNFNERVAIHLKTKGVERAKGCRFLFFHAVKISFDFACACPDIKFKYFRSLMTKKPTVIVSVTNDLFSDRRVEKSCEVLLTQGYDIHLVGRILPESQALNRPYTTTRFRLPFRKGFPFYAVYNLRLFFFLLFKKADMLWSNDLDTLLPNFVVSRLKGIPLVYDSHEYFTGVPEIQHRKFVKGVWTAIERFIFPKLRYTITVNDSIATLFEEQYGKRPVVVRNIPRKVDVIPANRNDLNLPEAGDLIILQGAGINVDRGAEEAVMAMKYLEDVTLLIIGGGDVYVDLKELARKEGVEHKVIFKTRMDYHTLLQHTALCSLGLSLDKPTNLNYLYSLPNKLFDYIYCGVPVVVSPVVEVSRIVRHYNLGKVLEAVEPKQIAEAVKSALEEKGQHAEWKENCRKAAAELNWENESAKLEALIKSIV